MTWDTNAVVARALDLAGYEGDEREEARSTLNDVIDDLRFQFQALYNTLDPTDADKLIEIFDEPGPGEGTQKVWDLG